MVIETQASRRRSRFIGLLAGPLLAWVIAAQFRPEGLPLAGTYVAAIASWMAVWWATEAINVAATAFLPLIAFPILGVEPIEDVSSAYAHPIIYLFLGGFIMAIAIEKSGLHMRSAIRIFLLAGVNSRAIVGSFMVAAAFISMWISNTSTTMMMLPVALSVSSVVKHSMPGLGEDELRNFEVSTLLGLAYGATIGGVSTLVGTPPNAFLAGFMESSYGLEIDFARWMIIGVPLSLVMLPMGWFVLVRMMYPTGFKASEDTVVHLQKMSAGLGQIKTAEVRVGLLFLVLVFGWLMRKPIVELTGAVQITDAAVAMVVALAAFIVPSGERGQALINWDDTRRLPWGVLVLFGGGLALASAMTESELTLWLGGQLAPVGEVHIALLVFCACILVIFLTELTSNLATTATFLPVVAALALQIDANPLVLLAPVTLASSFAFMLPVATPPNAIVFGSGRVGISTMMRAGVALNLIGVAILTLVALLLVPRVFG